ncbi:MAG: GntR family transcriptional regulator [Capsulimonadaceae bacterium]|nr:GntR family transcriptional regulator [Capsulimonadaceae bacterium]
MPTATHMDVKNKGRHLLRDAIAEAIRHDFIKGMEASPGAALPGIRELAQIYSVSTGTIQNAIGILQSQDAITAKTRSGCYVNSPREEQIQTASRGTGVDLIGFVCNKRSQLSLTVLSGIDSCCREYGAGVMAATAGHDSSEERAQVRRVLEAGCKGLILYPLARAREVGRPDYLTTDRFPAPIVLCDLALPSHPYSQVLFDNFKAGYDMARYLAGKGHSRIAFAGMSSQTALLPWRSLSDRYRGYVRALENAGKAVDDSAGIVEAKVGIPIDHEWCELWLTAWKSANNRPSALMAPEDETAVDLIRMAASMGIDVPGDLEICGFDDLPIRSLVPVPFATTHADWELAGRVCVEILLQHVRGELTSPVVYMLPVALVAPEA